MTRYIFLVTMLFLFRTAIAQPLQLPNGLTKEEFFGDMFAVIAFCNLTVSADQYELFSGMKAFGVSYKDLGSIHIAKDKHYNIYRQDFNTPTKHQEFCTKISSHPFISRIRRRGIPITIGSDDRRQSEKIELFAKSIATITFCNIPINNDKMGDLFVTMGFSRESFPALREKISTTRTELSAEYTNPQRKLQICQEIRNNLFVARLLAQ